jgi:hypothetical protein
LLREGETNDPKPSKFSQIPEKKSSTSSATLVSLRMESKVSKERKPKAPSAYDDSNPH